MDWWSVYIETRGEDPELVTDDVLGDFVTALVPHSGIATGGGGHRAWGARISVQALSPTDAVAQAADIVTRLGATAALPAWPVVHAEATREDVLDAELQSPAGH